VIYLKDRVDYLLSLKKPAGNELLFQVNQRIEKLKVKDNLDLMFNYRGKIITFTTAVLQIKDLEISCSVPDILYKDLDRSYSRVGVPSKMQVQFAFMGEMYNLSFPKVMEYETDDDDGKGDDILHDSDLRNLSGLIHQMGVWFKKNADAYKLIFFKTAKPSGLEEQVLAETGKALFLPSTGGNFPESDPFPQKRIITGDMFKRYLESTGVGQVFSDSACSRFIKSKADNNISSDAWVPILFREYVIGYIHIWNEATGKPPFDYSLLDTLYQFARVLSYSLKINGYFDKGKVKNDGFEGKVIDISASGLLFAYPLSSGISAMLRSKKKLIATIITPQRSIILEAKIVRRFKDGSFGYYGCQFEKVTEEDMDYLIEYIYGKSLSADDGPFLAGKV
jgi:hypothetical protein